ncbi:MAG TPA: hypothetical protein VHC98_02310 [Candidatus Saccharimonadales bacterium]|nr:hypothetical protein [Candidatus Saccharimonadales bacterium]
METNKQNITAQEVGVLSFGAGRIGEGKVPVSSELAATAAQLVEHTHELTHRRTAACGDGRPTLTLADGTAGEALNIRIEPQLFGGLGLSLTKAAVAANLALVRGAKTMWEAYQVVSKHLQELGYEDGGHAGCGASASVRASVEHGIAAEQLVPVVQLLAPGDDTAEALAEVHATKRRLLDNGFYDGWDPKQHEAYLTRNFPQNFATLAEDHHDPQHGHHENVIYVDTVAGTGFAKNEYVESTGRQAFAVTPSIVSEVTHLLCTNEAEGRRFHVAWADDTLSVGAGLAVAGMPIIAAA